MTTTPDDEYTPTTEEVRVTYGAGAYRSWIGTQPGLNAFDRWLAQHDAEVREAVAQDILTDGEAYQAADDRESSLYARGRLSGTRRASRIARGEVSVGLPVLPESAARTLRGLARGAR